jgi:hypothetical protein
MKDLVIVPFIQSATIFVRQSMEVNQIVLRVLPLIVDLAAI